MQSKKKVITVNIIYYENVHNIIFIYPKIKKCYKVFYYNL